MARGSQSSGRTILLRFGRPEHVPLPVNRVDQADGVAIVHLLSELPDADGDRVRIALVVVPDPLEDILAREHASPPPTSVSIKSRMMAAYSRPRASASASTPSRAHSAM